MKGPIRVLVADDHLVVRLGLKEMLEGEPDLELVGEAANGTEAVDLADWRKPDVVLMDLRMPELDGATAIARIKARNPDVQALVLTTYESDADVIKAIENGATGYMLKDAPREELLQAIRHAAEGKPILASSVTSRLMDRVREPATESLTSREADILELVAGGARNKEIAKELWITEITVKTHMTHIFEKLEVTDRTAAVTAALRRGILSLDP
ncbi:response regulator transcription factor [soil metagenome]